MHHRRSRACYHLSPDRANGGPCAEIVGEARPLAITFEDAAADLGLRKESQRTGTLRVVDIQGIDRSACGGTHVRTTAEIGPVLIRKTEKIRGNTRLEFVCGLRALRYARADFRTLQELSRQLSGSSQPKRRVW